MPRHGDARGVGRGGDLADELAHLGAVGIVRGDWEDTSKQSAEIGASEKPKKAKKRSSRASSPSKQAASSGRPNCTSRGRYSRRIVASASSIHTAAASSSAAFAWGMNDGEEDTPVVSATVHCVFLVPQRVTDDRGLSFTATGRSRFLGRCEGKRPSYRGAFRVTMQISSDSPRTVRSRAPLPWRGASSPFVAPREATGRYRRPCRGYRRTT